MGSYKLPFMILLSYSFGLKETAKLYEIKYSIVDEKPVDEQYMAQISDTQYIVFKKALIFSSNQT